MNLKNATFINGMGFYYDTDEGHHYVNGVYHLPDDYSQLRKAAEQLDPHWNAPRVQEIRRMNYEDSQPILTAPKRRAWNAGGPRVPGSGRKARGAEARSARVNAAVTPSVATLLQSAGGTQGDQVESAIRELVLLRYAHNGTAIPEWFVLDFDECPGCGVAVERGSVGVVHAGNCPYKQRGPSTHSPYIHRDMIDYCDECGKEIPEDANDLVNEYHKESCSLHPKNTIGA